MFVKVAEECLEADFEHATFRGLFVWSSIRFNFPVLWTLVTIPYQRMPVLGCPPLSLEDSYLARRIELSLISPSFTIVRLSGGLSCPYVSKAPQDNCDKALESIQFAPDYTITAGETEIDVSSGLCKIRITTVNELSASKNIIDGMNIIYNGCKKYFAGIYAVNAFTIDIQEVPPTDPTFGVLLIYLYKGQGPQAQPTLLESSSLTLLVDHHLDHLPSLSLPPSSASPSKINLGTRYSEQPMST
ncbi:hypothetical protein PGT21_020748 [Puccinia graminis f. sp. tritici]|uniref:Uncharacterized protein n=1 Tax=Puccinia graminis f. sp. tritici TaxID=56615 RepID=A0A5B0MUW0_PUCGR|nr:hypothetical protein PGT21_020748 [Puccinia graminis f. sp. tritici]